MRNDHSLLNTQEAAEYLGVKKSTIYAWVMQRRIPFVKVGHLLKFKRNSLDAWLRERESRVWD